MLSLYVAIPLLLLVALIQDVVLAPVSFLGAYPDLLFLVIVVWSLLRGAGEGMIWAFIGGFTLDLLSGGPIGGFTLSLLLVALVAGRQWGSELGSALLQAALIVLALCFIYHVLLLLVLGWSGRSMDWAYGLARVAAPSSILNALLAPLIYVVLAWLDRKSRPEGISFDGA
jgi:rod shape-determining protein MreD